MRQKRRRKSVYKTVLWTNAFIAKPTSRRQTTFTRRLPGHVVDMNSRQTRLLVSFPLPIQLGSSRSVMCIACMARVTLDQRLLCFSVCSVRGLRVERGCGRF
jgi:hypothetical protein